MVRRSTLADWTSDSRLDYTLDHVFHLRALPSNVSSHYTIDRTCQKDKRAAPHTRSTKLPNHTKSHENVRSGTWPRGRWTKVSGPRRKDVAWRVLGVKENHPKKLEETIQVRQHAARAYNSLIACRILVRPTRASSPEPAIVSSQPPLASYALLISSRLPAHLPRPQPHSSANTHLLQEEANLDYSSLSRFPDSGKFPRGWIASQALHCHTSLSHSQFRSVLCFCSPNALVDLVTIFFLFRGVGLRWVHVLKHGRGLDPPSQIYWQCRRRDTTDETYARGRYSNPYWKDVFLFVWDNPKCRRLSIPGATSGKGAYQGQRLPQ